MAIAETEVKQNSTEKIIEIATVEYAGDYLLHITFTDGKQTNVDFAPFLSASHHPGIRCYLDKSLFQGCVLQHGNVVWNDFEMIFPLSDLYEGSIRL